MVRGGVTGPGPAADGPPGPVAEIRRAAQEAADRTFTRLLAAVAEDSAELPGTLPGFDPAGLLGDLLDPGLLADLLVDGFGRAATEPPATPQGEPIAVAGPAGSTVPATVWVHETAAGAGLLRFTLTDLVAADGRRLPAAAARFVPAALVLPADGPVPARLEIAVPPTTGPGVFHGLVLTDGFPAAALPLRLTVQP